VSQDASKRYSKAQVGEGKVTVTDRGLRKEMLAKERHNVETNPGPKTMSRGQGSEGSLAMASQTITLGMQTSVEDRTTEPHVIALRKLLAEHCNGPFSEEVLEFAPILRVGGAMQEFDFVGCERIRRNRKARYITVDVAFPTTQWKGQNGLHVRQFLIQVVEMGLRCCLDRLRKDKVAVQEEKLLADFTRVKDLFLSQLLDKSEPI
jgi:hypothetical protein